MQFLTSAELAERWRLATGTLANWRTNRRGPDFIRLGDKHAPVIYELSAVEAFEAAMRVRCDNEDVSQDG
jgi:hypothetical protein